MKGRDGIFPLYVSWWYGEALVRFLNYLKIFFIYLFDFFSVEICLKTLLSVWRRDMIYYDDLSLHERFQAWMLNLASRIVGMCVKSATIAAYLVVTSIFLVVGLVALAFWVGLPLIIIITVYLMIKSL